MAELDARKLLRDALAQLAGDDGEMGDMRDMLPMLVEFLSAFGSAGFVCVMQAIPPAPPAIYRGPEGVRDGWRDFGSAFEWSRANLQEIRESSTATVVLVEQQSKTRHGGVEISQPSAMVFLFEGDAVARLEFHIDQQAALRAAGIRA